jgi:uncharacterized membrane protein
VQPHPRTTPRDREAKRPAVGESTREPAAGEGKSPRTSSPRVPVHHAEDERPSPRASPRRATGPLAAASTAATRSTSLRHSTVERIAAVTGGAALLAYAARRRSWRAVGFALAGAPLVYRGVSGHWPLPEGLAERAAQAIAPRPIAIETSVTVNRRAEDLYAFWRKLENLPRFMKNLEAVEEEAGGRSRWVARSPLGKHCEWEAEVVEDRPGALLSWRSLPGSQVESAGSVLFEPATGGRGTVVRVTMEIRPARGKALGKILAPLTRQQVREDLRRFKSLMEAGEVPASRGRP